MVRLASVRRHRRSLICCDEQTIQVASPETKRLHTTLKIQKLKKSHLVPSKQGAMTLQPVADVWSLWRSFVRDDPFGPDQFASTFLHPIDHLEYLHIFDVLLLFSFGLIDQSASECFLSWRRQSPSPRFPRQSCLQPPCRYLGCSAVHFASLLSANGDGCCQRSRRLTLMGQTDFRR